MDRILKFTHFQDQGELCRYVNRNNLIDKIVSIVYDANAYNKWKVFFIDNEEKIKL